MTTAVHNELQMPVPVHTNVELVLSKSPLPSQVSVKPEAATLA
jgi:hypothetical protein